jgi:hypothetical protein
VRAARRRSSDLHAGLRRTAAASGTVDVHPYSPRTWAGRRFRVRQVWTWRGPRYDLSLEIVDLDAATESTTILRTSYLAIPVGQVAALMRAVGFERVRRLDDRFFQPVLVGTRPPSSAPLTSVPRAG